MACRVANVGRNLYHSERILCVSLFRRYQLQQQEHDSRLRCRGCTCHLHRNGQQALYLSCTLICSVAVCRRFDERCSTYRRLTRRCCMLSRLHMTLNEEQSCCRRFCVLSYNWYARILHQDVIRLMSFGERECETSYCHEEFTSDLL